MVIEPVMVQTLGTFPPIRPYWTIPHTIAVEDILPKLADGVDYLVQHNIRVFGDWAESQADVN